MKVKNSRLLCILLFVLAACSNTEIEKKSSFLPEIKMELTENKEKGKLIFTFASLAYDIDEKWGKGVPKAGVERIAQVAHKYRMPVTWIINLGSGKALKSKLDAWHKEYGDDIALLWDEEVETERGRNNLQIAVDSLRVMFPWSELEVVASSRKSNELLISGKTAGASAIWGYCWEQVGIDGITDRGAPWGFFYASQDNYKLPSLEGKGMVSVEWTSRDLLKSLHSQAPTIYSSDPNDVGRTGLCNGNDIDYWKSLFDNYIRNIAHNKFVFFQQQQEAHEMEYGDVCKAYLPREIDESEKMLDAFFSYVKSYGDMVEFKTIPQAVQVYKESFSETEPVTMLFDDAPARKPPFWYARGYGAWGPWPKTLLYYDKECQMAFVEDQLFPIMYRDYINNRNVFDPEHYESVYSPEIKVRIPWSGDEELMEIPIEITSEKAIPYAISLWYDFNRYKVKRVEGAEFIGPIEEQALILRLNLKIGVNKVKIRLDHFN